MYSLQHKEVRNLQFLDQDENLSSIKMAKKKNDQKIDEKHKEIMKTLWIYIDFQGSPKKIVEK